MQAQDLLHFRHSLLEGRSFDVTKQQSPIILEPNTRPNEVNGAMEAFDALNIATINVFSVGMMTTGGLLYAFDISTLDDMRRKVRRRIGVEGDREDPDAEKGIEQWLASVLHITPKRRRKAGKGLMMAKGIVTATLPMQSSGGS